MAGRPSCPTGTEPAAGLMKLQAVGKDSTESEVELSLQEMVSVACPPSVGFVPGKSQADGVLISAAEVFSTVVRSAENIVLTKDPPKTRPVL